jgi:Tol biopolymer transport system component
MIGSAGMLGCALLAAALIAPAVADAAFPGHNGRIAFSSNRDGPQEIYSMNPDGGCMVRLTDHRRFDGFPAWSADGRKIAFRSGRDGPGHEIYVMNADGSDPVRLTENETFDGGPAWSPDGSRIAFRSDRDGNGEIYVMNADGSQQTRLTHNEASDSAPAWSPNGRLIAFVSDRDGTAKIYVMNADGSQQTRLTHSAADDAAPKWSPDGRMIAFDRHDGAKGLSGIHVMNADGSGQTAITWGPRIDGGPAFSPDGRRIAFRRNYGDENAIHVINVDGAENRRITNDGSSDRRADWQPLPLPSNDFCLRGARRNANRGFVRQAVHVPGAGRVIVRRSNRVRRFVRVTEEAGVVGVRVYPRGAAKQRLDRVLTTRRRMRVNVRARIAFRPAGGHRRDQVTRLRIVRIRRR